MPITTHVNWIAGSYENDRLYILRTAENPDGNLAAHFEGTSIAIGYGYDLLQHTNAEIVRELAVLNVTVTVTQQQLLDQARTGNQQVRGATRAQRGQALPLA